MLGGQRGGKGEVARGAGALYLGSRLLTARPCRAIPTVPFDSSATNLRPQHSRCSFPIDLFSYSRQWSYSVPSQSRMVTGMAGWSVGKPNPGLRLTNRSPSTVSSPFLWRLRGGRGSPAQQQNLAPISEDARCPDHRG